MNLNQDKEAQKLYDDRLKAIRDENSRTTMAHNKGKKEERTKMINAMKKRGMSESEINAILKLAEKE